MELLVMLIGIIKLITLFYNLKKSINIIYYKMTRGKHYSKESEIGRQCGNRFEKRHHNNDTRLRLKYKLAKSIEEKIR